MLLLVELILVQQSYALFLQFLGDVIHRLLKLLVVAGVEVVDFLYGLLSPLAVLLDVLVLRQGNAVERCHSHAEELVEVVRIDTQERHPLQYRHVLFLCLLQYAMVEIHPTQVALHECSLHLFFLFHFFIIIWFNYLGAKLFNLCYKTVTSGLRLC